MNLPGTNPEVLGRILFFQSSLHAVASERQIAEMTAQALAALPGAERVEVFLDGARLACAPMGARNGGEPPEDSACKLMPLRTVHGHYGDVWLTAGHPAALEPYLPFVANCLNLVSLHIEKGRTEAELKAANLRLDFNAKASADRFMRLFETTRDALSSLDPDTGRFDTGNPSMLILFGLASVEALQELNWLDLSPELQPDGGASQAMLEAFILQARWEGSCFFEWEFRRRDGGTFNADVLLTSFGLEPGAPLHSSIRDTSRRRQEERELRKLNRSLRASMAGTRALAAAQDEAQVAQQICGIIVETCGYPMAWVGLDSTAKGPHLLPVAGAADGFCDRFIGACQADARRQGAAGRALLSGKPELCLDPGLDPACRAWQDGGGTETLTAILALPLFSGSESLGVLSIFAGRADAFLPDEVDLLRELAGHLEAGMALVRNRLAGIRHEKALGRSEARFRSLFHEAPIAMCLVDSDFMFVDRNKEFLALTGYGEHDLDCLADWWGLAFPDPAYRAESRKAWYQWREDRATPGTLASQQEVWITCKNGAKKYVLFSGIQLEREFLGIAIDLTERRDAQEKLMQAQKMQSLGHLAGGVAHDMNNVLAAILALATANQQTHPEDAELGQTFDTIARAAIRGGDMVRRLLSLSRKSPAKEQDVDLSALVREQVLLLERTTLARVRLDLELAESLPCVKGDPAALAHAIMNLCVNAVDAMDGEGTLTLQTRLGPDGQVELRVADTGCGMTEEVRASACDPFFTTKPQGKGTGLGLPMVYNTIKTHGGELTIESRPGAGTRVAIQLPAASGTAAEPSALAPASPGTPLPLSILLVDDDELIRTSLGAVIRALGHEAVLCPSGEEALARLGSGLRPEVIILDLNMPGIGGAGTLHGIAAMLPDIPVFLSTGNMDQAADDLARRYPKVSLLPKPFTLTELSGLLTATR
jgi:PAS domain S-box-containing protein